MIWRDFIFGTGINHGEQAYENQTAKKAGSLIRDFILNLIILSIQAPFRLTIFLDITFRSRNKWFWFFLVEE